MNCRYCKSNSLFFTKHLNWGPKMGNCYHYKVHCKSCHKSYNVERCKEIFDKIKDKNWIYSKSYKKHYFGAR